MQAIDAAYRYSKGTTLLDDAFGICIQIVQIVQILNVYSEKTLKEIQIITSREPWWSSLRRWHRCCGQC